MIKIHSISIRNIKVIRLFFSFLKQNQIINNRFGSLVKYAITKA